MPPSLISVAIILAAGLSFLGLGVKPPEPEWGLMLNTLRQAIYVNPVLAALPGVMIFIDLDLLQPDERRAARGHGREGLSIDRGRSPSRRAIAAARPSRCCSARGLRKHFPVRGGGMLGRDRKCVRAVDDLSFASPRARPWAWWANRAAASRRRRAC